MKTSTLSHSALAVSLLFTTVACHKSIVDTQERPDISSSTRPETGLYFEHFIPDIDTTAPLVPYPSSSILNGCNLLPIYGDSIIYPQPTTNQDYILNPVNSPGSGQYFAWPKGLDMDAHTGAINLTRSAMGMKYAIGFVADGTTDTCLSTLVIGGASYIDSVYVLDNGTQMAVPYFDADAAPSTLCDGSGGPDKCKFDLDGQLKAQRIEIDKNNGQIDLAKSLKGSGSLGGVFGPNPINGQTVYTRLYYQLQDKSNKTVEYIDLRLQYFDKKSDIDPSVLDNIVSHQQNWLTGGLISKGANPRPPLIVIVRKGF